jgi:post-segregation antitoxin (ccd killing protein)
MRSPLAQGIVAEVRAQRLNLSRVVEGSSRDAVGTEPRRQWLVANAASLAAYERFVEAHGVFNEAEREW